MSTQTHLVHATDRAAEAASTANQLRELGYLINGAGEYGLEIDASAIGLMVANLATQLREVIQGAESAIEAARYEQRGEGEA